MTVKLYGPEAETAAGQNDSIATAEAAFEYVPTTPDPTRKDYLIVGHLSPATDVDIFKFEGIDADNTNMECYARRNGSGLQAVTFSILGPGDPDAGTDGGTPPEVQSETETDAANVIWSDYPYPTPSKPPTASAAGTWYLKVSATGQDTDVAGNYYFCSLYIIPPYTGN